MKKSAKIERYQMGLYHISKGTSQANFVQNLVLLSEFERFLLEKILRTAFSWILAAIFEKAAILERYQMGLYHISKGASQANFVQTFVLLTKFEQFLHIFTENGWTISYMIVLAYLGDPSTSCILLL